MRLCAKPATSTEAPGPARSTRPGRFFEAHIMPRTPTGRIVSERPPFPWKGSPSQYIIEQRARSAETCLRLADALGGSVDYSDIESRIAAFGGESYTQPERENHG